MTVTTPTRISLRNILVATDFSCCSEVLLPYARSLAQQYDATLLLAHVLSPEALNLDPTMADTARTNAEHLMEDLEGSDQLEGVRHKRILEEGNTWEVLQRTIEQEHVDLVIVGTHGRTGLVKLVMGSIAERIFRHATCPVMTIGPRVAADAKRDAKFNHVLLATDLKPQDAEPTRYAMSLARDHGARFSVVHVIQPGECLHADQLLAFLPTDVAMEYPPEPVVVPGDPVEEIMALAASRQTDLIVLGVHRPKLITSGRDIAYRVVCAAPCPVLTVAASE